MPHRVCCYGKEVEFVAMAKRQLTLATCYMYCRVSCYGKEAASFSHMPVELVATAKRQLTLATCHIEFVAMAKR